MSLWLVVGSCCRNQWWRQYEVHSQDLFLKSWLNIELILILSKWGKTCKNPCHKISEQDFLVSYFYVSGHKTALILCCNNSCDGHRHLNSSMGGKNEHFYMEMRIPTLFSFIFYTAKHENTESWLTDTRIPLKQSFNVLFVKFIWPLQIHAKRLYLICHCERITARGRVTAKLFLLTDWYIILFVFKQKKKKRFIYCLWFHIMRKLCVF